MQKAVLLFLSLIMLFTPSSFERVYAQESNVITCDQALDIISTQKCPNWIIRPETGVWCNMPPDLQAYKQYPPNYLFPPGVVCTFEKYGENQENNVETPTDKDSTTSKQNKRGKGGNPFNIFGINPYVTWLNLRGLAEARAFMATGAFDRFAESTILHSVGAEPSWERDARETEALNKFINQEAARFVKLNGKTAWTEINDSTKKTLIEAAKDSVTIKKDSAIIDLQPLVGEKGVLETGGKPMLRSGAADVIVEPQNGKPFEMQTPNIELLVIGTQFSVVYDRKKGETLVAVYQGRVEVKTKDGKTDTVIPDGDKPGVVLVSQKLSIPKLILTGVVLIVIIGGAFLFLRKRGSGTSVRRR